MILNDVLKTPENIRVTESLDYHADRQHGMIPTLIANQPVEIRCNEPFTENERTNRKNIVAKMDTSSRTGRATLIDKTHLLNVFQRLHY